MGDRKRDEVIAFRVTAAERTQIHVVEELKSILSELRACGRNLNQLPMRAHEGHIQTVDLWETADMLGKTYEAVNALLTAKDQVISHGNV